MKLKRMLLTTTATMALAASHASAQSTQTTPEERPAMASYWGDTGLWFLPTAEVVRPQGMSFSIYRSEFDFKQGRTDVEDWPVTAAVGIGRRLELFGALRAVTRIDRDTRPVFEPNQDEGGVVNDRPFVREPWTGAHLGDLYIGAKGNLVSESDRHPVAVALRGTVKLPTADDESGSGSGEFDYFGDVVVSKELRRRVEVTGFGGFAIRGDPADISLSDGFRWGVGAALGARSNLRLTGEVFGEVGVDSTVDTVAGSLTGVDGSAAPTVSRLDQGVTSAVGVTWQHKSGLALGAGLTFQTGINYGDDQRSGFGMQFRMGFHRGVRVFVEPPPPARAAAPEPPPPPVTTPPPAPAKPAPAANRQPAIQAQCNPCRVEVGRSVQIRVDGKDPDGDQLQYRWSAKGGTIADTRAAATTWTAETVPGTVPLVVTVDDGRGGVATSTINIEVVGAPVTELADIQFELNRFEIRPDAMAALDRAVEAMKQNPAMRLRVEGHASEEATAEYNLALGERRANAVREYLVSRGVAASRLSTVSYGETRPKYDNTREETRRLNRRAALVVEGGK
jgi:outer membrane protein OmpA-like peptidoglycan-associated protein